MNWKTILASLLVTGLQAGLEKNSSKAGVDAAKNQAIVLAVAAGTAYLAKLAESNTTASTTETSK